ncbi:hypothetical protein TNCV_3759011 [Trichonephila clavipes]|nr:hypothetical protein TNCV_3759011 [Trichonephila clavipes]
MPSIKTDSPLLYEMTSLLRTSASPPMSPINHHAPTTLLRKARLLASHNELSRLSTISPKTANELMIKHFEHFGQ